MRRTSLAATAWLLLLGGAGAGGVASCAEADCVDLGTCAAADDPGIADAGRPDGDRDALTPPEATPETPTNEYGDPYPMENQGWTPRRAGSATPGNVIPNVAFETAVDIRLGAPPPGDATITRLELAKLFDPTMRNHDVIILVLATFTDNESRPFLEGLGAAPPDTVVLTALGTGALPGSPPTKNEFVDWANTYYWSRHVLDASFARLGNLTPSGKATFVLIDATTMELAFLKTGPMSQTELSYQLGALRARR
ncbi:MAG: hypothetical protein KF764_00275 [Labilithrix sp.]|nr:hypothetical protein [Labilithrix sp.]